MYYNMLRRTQAPQLNSGTAVALEYMRKLILDEEIVMIDLAQIRKISIRVVFGLCVLLWGAVFLSCDDCDDCRVVVVGDTPPPAPQGVYSVTGNNAVYLYWNESPPELHVSHYWVWRGTEAIEGPYIRKWEVSENHFVDHTAKNGKTYYYAVTAVDYDGYESEYLSTDDVMDTPRPEGGGVVLYDVHDVPDASGFDFESAHVETWDTSLTDIFFEYDSDYDVFFVWARTAKTDIQDYGWTDNLDELDWAPAEGWSRVGWLEAILGHSYYVWTDDDHYAKFRIDHIDYEGAKSVTISWAYQVDPGNPELVPPRPEHFPRHGSLEKFVDASNLR